MNGETLRKKIKENGYDLVDIAQALGISAQALNSKLNANDLKYSFIEQVAKAINKNVYEIIYDKNFVSNTSQTNKNLIPLFNDVATIGGTEVAAETNAVANTTDYIDAGDWFPGATAAIRHYGDSMNEYPSGCILALKKVVNRDLLIWGRNYCIETAEFRITKKIARSSNEENIILHSSNTETYPDGTLIHSPIEIPKGMIINISLVLGNVTKELSSGAVRIVSQ